MDDVQEAVFDQDLTVLQSPPPALDATELQCLDAARDEPPKQAAPIGIRAGRIFNEGALDQITRVASGFDTTNELARCAASLLNLASAIRVASRCRSVVLLHKYARKEIFRFEANAQQLNIDKETIRSARYLLCSTLDEAVLHTPWGYDSAWAKRTLLSLFHNETSGGERCFQMLRSLQRSAARHWQLLELFYLAISLGFEGKYRLDKFGRTALERLCRELLNSLSHHRPDNRLPCRGPARVYSPSVGSSPVAEFAYHRESLPTREPFLRRWWPVFIAVTLVIVSGFGFKYSLERSSDELLETLKHYGTVYRDTSSN